MPTLERYLKDIRAHLPSDQADDIVAELGENLRAQIDDREEALGRSLTEAELDALLKEHGNPLVVAARYRPDQPTLAFGRQLIGPALFPAYRQVLAINFAITGFVVLMAAVLVASGQSLGNAASGIALAFLIQFGVVTGIFIAADRMITGESSLGSVDASAFPAGDDRSWLDRIGDGLIGKDTRGVVPRRTSATDLAVSAIFVGWLVAIRPPQEIGFLRSGPGWETYYLPLVLVVALGALQPIVNLVRPTWTGLRSVARIAADAAILILFIASIRLGEWVALSDPAGADSGARTAVVEINRWIGLSLTIAAAIAAAQVLLEVRRLWLARAVTTTTVGAAI